MSSTFDSLPKHVQEAISAKVQPNRGETWEQAVAKQLGTAEDPTPFAIKFCEGLCITGIDSVRKLAWNKGAPLVDREIYDDISRLYEAEISLALSVPPSVIPPSRCPEDVKILCKRYQVQGNVRVPQHLLLKKQDQRILPLPKGIRQTSPPNTSLASSASSTLQKPQIPSTSTKATSPKTTATIGPPSKTAKPQQAPPQQNGMNSPTHMQKHDPALTTATATIATTTKRPSSQNLNQTNPNEEVPGCSGDFDESPRSNSEETGHETRPSVENLDPKPIESTTETVNQSSPAIIEQQQPPQPSRQLLRRTSSLNQLKDLNQEEDLVINEQPSTPTNRKLVQSAITETTSPNNTQNQPSVSVTEATPTGTPSVTSASTNNEEEQTKKTPPSRPKPKLEQKIRVIDMGTLREATPSMTVSFRKARSPSQPPIPTNQLSQSTPPTNTNAVTPLTSNPPTSPLLANEKQSKEKEKEQKKVIRPKQPPVGFARGSHELLLSLIIALSKVSWTSSDLIDYWSSRHIENEQWINASFPNDSETLRCLVDKTIVGKAGYSIELCFTSMTHLIPAEADKVVVIDSEEDYNWYKHFFQSNHHDNFVSIEGPCVVSIETHCKSGGTCKAIVRTTAEDKRVLLPSDKSLKVLESLVPELKNYKLKRAKTAIVYELVSYEDLNIHLNYKFGLIYCKPGEKDENEMFGNPHGSQAYEEFLEFIGDKIPLLGWKQFRGGLDVKSNNTGTQSVFTQFHQFQIMFHVATMLPLDPKDEQKLERKRHIGNDVVVLIFKDQLDSNDTFNPLNLITSHFIHCIFVVSPAVINPIDGKTTHYWLTVCNKPRVPPYSPFMPQSSRFQKGPAFKQFLLTKMINAERTALGTGEFTSIAFARKKQLERLCTEFVA